MFRRALFAMLMLAASGAAAAAADCPSAKPEDLRKVFETWQAAYRARDLAGTMAVFSKDVVFQFQGAPDAGWAQLEASFKSEFASQADADWRGTFQAVEVSGDLAAVFSQWQQVVRDAQGSETIKARNNAVDVFRRDASCRWLIVRSLNYPLTPAK